MIIFEQKKASNFRSGLLVVGVAVPMIRGNLLYLMIFEQKKALNFRSRFFSRGGRPETSGEPAIFDDF